MNKSPKGDIIMHGFDKWDARFMELAHTIANWASCYQENRKIGGNSEEQAHIDHGV